MLYEFASVRYLKGLHTLVTQFIDGIVDPLLDVAKSQNRDSMLTDARWGTRNTSANWSNNAWPFLKEFQASLAKDIAGRAADCYKPTGVNNCLRGVSEYSLQWTTEEEEKMYNDAEKLISSYALNIDDTLDDYYLSKWDDYGFACDYYEFAKNHPKVPKFQIRTDIVGESGKVPPRTGVYIPQGDPNGSVQFAWVGGGGGKLRPANTFNEIGVDALQAVGRKDLWINEEKMFEFATASKHAGVFLKDAEVWGKLQPHLAPSTVARYAFTEMPCQWYFMEIVDGESEHFRYAHDENPAPVSFRVSGGGTCKTSGYYITPAQANTRHYFKTGDTMQSFASDYGETIWQWDSNQDGD